MFSQMDSEKVWLIEFQTIGGALPSSKYLNSLSGSQVLELPHGMTSLKDVNRRLEPAGKRLSDSPAV